MRPVHGWETLGGAACDAVTCARDCLHFDAGCLAGHSNRVRLVSAEIWRGAQLPPEGGAKFVLDSIREYRTSVPP